MPNRTAKFASAIFASLLAGVPITTISHSAAGADDECLSSPKDQTPQGGHWYYRIDHATKRHCWYLKEDGEKLAEKRSAEKPSSEKPSSEKSSKVTPSNNSSSVARPAPPKSETAMQRSIADARAELPQRTGIEQPNQDTRPNPAISAGAAVSEINRDAKPPVAETQRSLVASRWLGQSDADPATSSTFLTSPTPLASPMPNSPMPNPNSPTANKDYPDTNVTPAPPTQPPSPLAASQFAAADLSSETPTHSVQMLLAAIMGALALAGIMGRVIFKFVGPRSPANRSGRGRRGAIWKSAATGRRASRVYPGADALPPRPDFPRDLDQVSDPDEKIAELLRDFSRKSRKRPNQRQPSVGLFL
jgi:hypothetical protein